MVRCSFEVLMSRFVEHLLVHSYDFNNYFALFAKWKYICFDELVILLHG